MAGAAVWHRFSVDKVASHCFLQCFCVLRHCALYKTRFGTVSLLSWKWLPKTEAYGQGASTEIATFWAHSGYDWAKNVEKSQNGAILKRFCCWD